MDLEHNGKVISCPPTIHPSIHPSRWAGSLLVPKTLALIVTAGLYFLGQILFAL
jgi:hypothetical protein